MMPFMSRYRLSNSGICLAGLLEIPEPKPYTRNVILNPKLKALRFSTRPDSLQTWPGVAFANLYALTHYFLIRHWKFGTAFKK